MITEELKVNEFFKEIESVKNFIVARGFNNSKLTDLTSKIKERKNSISGIYWINCLDSSNNYSFKSIKFSSGFGLKTNGIISASAGIVLPQDVPIVFVIENFDQLSLNDQREFIENICQKEDHKYYPKNYLHHDSIVILSTHESYKIPIKKSDYKLKFWILKTE